MTILPGESAILAELHSRLQNSTRIQLAAALGVGVDSINHALTGSTTPSAKLALALGYEKAWVKVGTIA